MFKKIFRKYLRKGPCPVKQNCPVYDLQNKTCNENYGRYGKNLKKKCYGVYGAGLTYKIINSLL